MNDRPADAPTEPDDGDSADSGGEDGADLGANADEREVTPEVPTSTEQAPEGTVIEAGVARDAIVEFLRTYLSKSDADGYVLGISGGLDSAVAATLAVEAVGPSRVTGIVMPGEPSDPENMADARKLCAALDIDHYEVDIAPLVEGFSDAIPYDLEKVGLGNVRARTRMVLWYADANANDRLVLGADNRAEVLLGYFTKHGDNGVDVSALGDLYKTEVAALARYVDLSDRFIEKTPTAGLWEGQTDEGEIGVRYAVVDDVLRHVVDRGHSISETVAKTGYDREAVERVVELHRASEHKRSPPESPGLRH
ncbi:NAD+ synthase [Haloparvum sp. PAK95]|uniref:NAD+ synthase n=1 Tax=Haloparvum sp. PAK95 TaxID=3418962 RepID=UPI003D2F3218